MRKHRLRCIMTSISMTSIKPATIFSKKMKPGRCSNVLCRDKKGRTKTGAALIKLNRQLIMKSKLPVHYSVDFLVITLVNCAYL